MGVTQSLDMLHETVSNVIKDDHFLPCFIIIFFMFFSLLLLFVSDPSIHDSEAASPDKDDKEDPENMDKHKKKVNKATKPKHEAKGHFIFNSFIISSDDDNILQLVYSNLTLFHISLPLQR